MTLFQTLAANKIIIAALLAWRAAPTPCLVTVKGLDGVYRFNGRVRGDVLECVKQKDGKDWQASKFFGRDRVSPVVG